MIDPSPLPPSAVLDAPQVGGRPISDWRQLAAASQSLVDIATEYARPDMDRAQVASLIQTAATTATVTDAGTGSPNLLAYTGVGTITTPPPTPLTSVAVGALSGKGLELERYWLASVSIRSLPVSAGFSSPRP